MRVENTLNSIKHIIDKELGFEPPIASGYQIFLKTFIRSMPVLKDDDGNVLLDNKGNPKTLIIPEQILERDKWIACTGLVVAMGPLCYKDEKFKGSGPWCKIGDWVIFPRNSAKPFEYRGVSMMSIDDDRILGITPDPSFASRE